MLNTQPRILVLDGYTMCPGGDLSWLPLRSLGQLDILPRCAPEKIPHVAREAHIILTNKAPLRAETLATLPALRFISVLATGYNIVDVAAAKARGIPVSNVPDYSTEGVAQHVFALLLELAHRTGDHHRSVQAGDWKRCPDFSYWHSPLLELAGLTFGVVGLGRIGRKVATIAAAFGMKVLASGRKGSVKSDDLKGIEIVTMEELFTRSDVVSLHCPLTSENSKFVNEALLGRMKRSAFFINTARGGLVDEEDLAEALRHNRIGGAGLDVLSVEPMSPACPLFGLANCIITPHMAWGSLASRRRLLQVTIDNIQAFLAGSPIHVVNS